MRKPFLLLPLSLVTGLAACGGETPAPPADVQARIASDLGNVLRQTKAASDSSTQSLPDGATLTMLSQAWSGASGSTGVSFARATPIAKLFRAVTPRGVVKTARVAPEDPPADDGFDPDAITKQLNETLFTDANYAGDGIYNIPASLLCPSTVDSGGAPTDAVDPECAQRVTDAQLRIHVTEDSDTLKLALQVDANHDEPLTIELRHDALSASVSLDDASRAIQALAPIFGEEAPNARLSGQITAELDILGSSHVKAGVTIDRALDIAIAAEGVDLASADAIRFTSAAADVVSVELDGNAPLARVDVALGATTAHVPGTEFDSTTGEEQPSNIDLDLGGASVSAKLEAGGLTLSNIGLGDRTTTVSKNGTKAVSIDLNPNDGRHLGATLSVDAGGVETLEVSPKLDLRLAVDHVALGDEAPTYDVTQLLVSGALQGTASGIKVVSGGFKVVTNPAGFGVDATAGQCVTTTEVSDANSGAFYTQWSAGTCE